MKYLITLVMSTTLLVSSCAQSQSKLVGGPCEGCEAVNNYGDRLLKATDTIVGFNKRPDKIWISGTVYKNDAKTPAENVILYIYHTDHTGRYPNRPSSKGWEKRHGYLRTWLKTDAKGHYEFYTTRPASYPNSTIPQHIHITVKEPEVNAYYIEDFYFADDPNITPNILNRAKPRGGSGVIHLKKNGDFKIARRDIILGLNIPNY
ncbi:intradiol ring-cleavage dioxygenase [uncultured Psychroserpens sp.]|uniref:dioxygenase family protein n=1 Tax=uncultured Psychroserpens sp. TaxID=255436 RepID=UPI00261E4A6E|nr:intradiol ring-cleavage dioxygenase [uncultured Psychroserpens sp.]